MWLAVFRVSSMTRDAKSSPYRDGGRVRCEAVAASAARRLPCPLRGGCPNALRDGSRRRCEAVARMTLRRDLREGATTYQHLFLRIFLPPVHVFIIC